MKDIDIRQVLLKNLNTKYHNDPDTLLIEELGLCQGEARIDLAVVNGSLHGYEIKSDRDTLIRLKDQQAIYNKTLNYVTIVAGSKHLSKVEEAVPSWWEIKEATKKNDAVKIKQIRRGKKNPNIDPNAIVQLLWRDEAFEILKELNLHKGKSNATREVLWNLIVETISIKKLELIVRKTIKSRAYWR